MKTGFEWNEIIQRMQEGSTTPQADDSQRGMSGYAEIHADAREATARQTFKAMVKTDRPDIAIAILLRAIDEWFEKGLMLGKRSSKFPLKKSRDEAHEAWNTRESDEVIRGLVEALQYMVDFCIANQDTIDRAEKALAQARKHLGE